MTDQPHDGANRDALGTDALGADDLDGHTIDELADYLDAGMTPADPSIDESPACQNALAALVRLRQVSMEALEADARNEPPAEESWISGLLRNISIEARSGRDIPLQAERPTERGYVTEGAVRSLVRSAGDEVPGVLVERCRLDGDVTEPGAPIRVTVAISVRWGASMPTAADDVRSAVAESLAVHTDLHIDGIDVEVRDVIVEEATDD